MIAKNPYNVIPLHESKDEWYSEKKTFHGVCRHPIMPLGHIPPMSVTPNVGDPNIYEAVVTLFNLDGEKVDRFTTGVTPILYARDVKAYFIKQFDFGNEHDEGVYYVETNIGEDTLYSEPFMWIKDTSRLIRIEYMRNSPIVTTDNYIHFEDFFEMYIDSEIMMPEYRYDTEVEEIDGVKFVRKKVSYKEHKFSFLCTDYFAEAVRLMWHCNIIKITQHGNEYNVDYMEAPQPSWNADNHLMQMDIVFQTDTIMQTNGESKAW